MKTHPEYVRFAARRLHRDDGLTYREIGDSLGVPRSTVYRWVNPDYAEKTRRSSAEAKRRRTGTCEDCGSETRYNSHAGKIDAAGASRFCRPCAAIRNGAEQKIWTRDLIVAAIQWWVSLYGKQPAIPDFNPSGAVLLSDYRRTVRAERHIAAREIPWFTTVVREFGSWNAAIAAAGFAPLANHGGGGNVARHRKRFA